MDLELHFPLPKKKLPLGEMLAGSRRWLQLSEPQHQNGRVCFHPGLFAFQSPLIAFKCFIAQTPNTEERSESSAAKMLWCAWEAGQQTPPPSTSSTLMLAKGLWPAAGRHATAGDPGYLLCTIRQGRTSSTSLLRQPFAKKEVQLPSTCATSSVLFTHLLSRFTTPFHSAPAANNSSQAAVQQGARL